VEPLGALQLARLVDHCLPPPALTGISTLTFAGQRELWPRRRSVPIVIALLLGNQIAAGGLN